MGINLLIKLTENDKRLIFALLLIVFLVLLFVGVIGMLVTKVMKYQGKKLDALMHDITITGVADNKKKFRKIAHKKNWILFYKRILIPLLIIVVGVVFLLVIESSKSWSYDLFEHQKTGIGTLFYIWDINDPSIYTTWFGLHIIADWPKIINTPHFEMDAIFSYIIIPLFLIGGIWYLVEVQCFLSRSIRIITSSNKIYNKNLDEIDFSKVEKSLKDN